MTEKRRTKGKELAPEPTICHIIDAQHFEIVETEGAGYTDGIKLLLESVEDRTLFRSQLTAQALAELVGAETTPNSMEIIRIAKWLIDDPNPVSILLDSELKKMIPTSDHDVVADLQSEHLQQVNIRSDTPRTRFGHKGAKPVQPVIEIFDESYDDDEGDDDE